MLLQLLLLLCYYWEVCRVVGEACGVLGRLFYSYGVGVGVGEGKQKKTTKKRVELECVGGRKITRKRERYVRTGCGCCVDIDIDIVSDSIINNHLLCVCFVCFAKYSVALRCW